MGLYEDEFTRTQRKILMLAKRGVKIQMLVKLTGWTKTMVMATLDMYTLEGDELALLDPQSRRHLLRQAVHRTGSQGVDDE